MTDWKLEMFWVANLCEVWTAGSETCRLFHLFVPNRSLSGSSRPMSELQMYINIK
jgi:hypothetical protein